MSDYLSYLKHTAQLKSADDIGFIRLFFFSLLTLVFANVILTGLALLIPLTPVFTEENVINGPRFSSFMAIAVYPILEELAFSLFLSRKRNHIITSISMLVGLLPTCLIMGIQDFDLSFLHVYFVGMWVLFSFLASLFVLLPVFGKVNLVEAVSELVRDDHRTVGYLTVVYFTLIHVYFIYIFYGNLFLGVSLFLCSLYVVFRFVTNQVRMTYGIIAAILFHAGYNLYAYWDSIFFDPAEMMSLWHK